MYSAWILLEWIIESFMIVMGMSFILIAKWHIFIAITV